MSALRRRLARAWSVMTSRHWAWASASAILLSLSIPLQNLDVNAYWALQKIVYHTPWLVLFGYFFMGAIAWVESARDESGSSTLRYAVAAFVAGSFCIAITWAFAPLIPMAPHRLVEGRLVPTAEGIDPVVDRRFYHAATLGLDAAIFGALATLIHARLRCSRLAERRLAQAELLRSEKGRDLLASRLDAARAAVDPETVIGELERIERAYETDAAGADARLDALILLLRDAIPPLRGDRVAGYAP